MQESEIPMTLDGWKLKISSKIALDLLYSILAGLDVSRALFIDCHYDISLQVRNSSGKLFLFFDKNYLEILKKKLVILNFKKSDPIEN